MLTHYIYGEIVIPGNEKFICGSMETAASTLIQVVLVKLAVLIMAFKNSCYECVGGIFYFSVAAMNLIASHFDILKSRTSIISN